MVARRFAKLFAGILAVVVLAHGGRADAAECATPLGPNGTPATTAGVLLDSEAVAQFYEKVDNRCVWTDGTAEKVVAILARAGREGLNPTDFHLGALSKLAHPKTPEASRDRDILLSDAALRYARVMSAGRVDLAKVETDSEFQFQALSYADDLAAALSHGNADGYLAGLGPKGPAYDRLADALARYRELTEKGGWLPLPEGPSLRPGISDARVVALEARLKAEGVLARPGTSEVYDAAAVAAVKRFQSNHGLSPDGVVGPKTLAALNVPAADRVRQIEVNLERWRILARVIPATRFEVNVPAATARLVIDGRTRLEMKAVVGDPKHPTPMLASKITDIVINPYWTVPPSIVKAEIEPIIARDPGYLDRNHMKWINGSLVQDPGGTNPLGRLRFTFANKFGVFVHDTSAPGLFANYERARSHGCLRLERPVDLATVLLSDNPAWPRDKIEATIAAGTTVKIGLMKPMPVVIAYWTAFVDEDGTIEFRNDIYGRDARLAAALASAESLEKSQASAEACGAT